MSKEKSISDLLIPKNENVHGVSQDDFVSEIIELREHHKEMDQSVLEAYGWHQDDPKWGKAIQLRHDFYEVDYLPDNDRVRFTIHPEARKEVLKRLLQLNHERFAEEVAEGLHDKGGGKKDTKEKKEKTPKKLKVKEPQTQEALFVDEVSKNNLPLKLEEDKKDEGLRKIQVGSVVKLQSKDGRVIKIACGIHSSEAQSLKTESAFVQALLGKSVGQWVKFGNGFEILGIE
jgi:transcription elongation GreA/GreB family factor